MAPYAPPADLEVVAARAGVPPSAIIKLDANENPYGPTPSVRRALAKFDGYHRYPDPDAKALRPLVARYAGVDAEQVLLGNGSDELIDLLCRIHLEPGDEILDCTPTFGMYRFSADLSGANTVEVPRTSGWDVDPDCIERAIGPRTKIVFFATPNNPTGNSLPEPTLVRLLDTGLLVVLDEAYVEFSPWPSFTGWVARFPNLVVLRTFSKWAGLAGLRVGYGVFPGAIAHHLWKVKPPFNVNLAAEVAVQATLGDLPRVQRGVRSIVRERDRMARGLRAVPGLRVWPSDANFLLVQPEQPPATPGSPLNDALVRGGIAVRSYRHPRLANAVRISVGLPSHTDAVVAALQDWGQASGVG